MKELISVIVPVYNVEKDLENCLKSLINQTYDNLQIILVDDGSTDSCGTICDNYKKIDNRIEIIHKANGGLADARNAGLKIVRGQYVAFLDSDDYIYRTMYEDLYKLLKENDSDIAECDFLRIDVSQKGNEESIINEENFKRKIETNILSNIDALRLLYGANIYEYVKKVVVWNKLYKREVINGIWFPTGRLHEDEFTTHKILYNANKIVSTNKILHGYMQTSGSIMRKPLKPKRIKDTLDSYMSASEFFKEEGLVELEAKTRRRYLEYCIELAGKIINSDNNKELLDQLVVEYKSFYEKYRELINNVKTSLKEKKIIDLLNEVYIFIKKENNFKIEYCDTIKKLNM